MGAGVSQKTMNGYYYRRLKKIQRELQAAGVPCTYSRYMLIGTTEMRLAWRVAFNTLRASNGEPLRGMMQVYISPSCCMPNWPSLYESGTIELGLERIKQRFSNTRFNRPTEATQ